MFVIQYFIKEFKKKESILRQEHIYILYYNLIETSTLE